MERYMDYLKFWQKFLKTQSIIAVYIVTFGTLWALLEPLGIKPGIPLFIILILIAVLLATSFLLGQKLYENVCKIDILNKQIEKLTQEKSFCCVLNQKTSICPLGVTHIYNQAIETITTSITEAKHSYKWLGYSAFNVVHNHQNLFQINNQVKYEFVTLNPNAENLLAQVDKDFHSTLRPTNQANNAEKIINELIKSHNHVISIKHHSQLPSFRLILIDEKKALVSFYETGKDALTSPQIEITENPESKYSLLPWFQTYYDKVVLTQKLLNKTGQKYQKST
jgi:hypothetical protein